MPYDPENPPEKVRGLSPTKQRQWVHVFNSCYEKNGDEELCHKEAWGVTGGWQDKESKGMDLDILAENLIEDEVVEKSILPDLMNTMISDKLGFDVEVKDVEIDK